MEIAILLAGMIGASLAHVGIVLGRHYEKAICGVCLVLPAAMIWGTLPGVLDVPADAQPRWMFAVCFVMVFAIPQLMFPATRQMGRVWESETRFSARRTLRSEVRERVRFHYGEDEE